MSTPLSKLADNLSEIYSKKCRNKNCKSECELKWLKNNKLSHNCKKSRKKQLKPIHGLIKKFPNTYKFFNNDISKFMLLLRKGVYLYEFMESWERFMETTFSKKKSFYSKLHLEDVADEDSIHTQKVLNFKFNLIQIKKPRQILLSTCSK